MVDRVDKPERATPYRIDSAAEAKKDREQGGGGASPNSDEYSGSHAAPGWQRIYAQTMNRKYLKFRREDIVRIWFRSTVMQRGISLADVDIEIRDGRVIKGAHVILSAREDFWTLKRFHPGQDVPLNMIVKDEILEVSVPAQGKAAQVTMKAEKSTVETAVNGSDTKKIAIYAAIGIAALILALILIFR